MSTKPESKAARKPTTYKIKEEHLERLQRIAEKNGLSRNAVVNLCVASGLQIVETKLAEMIGEQQEVAA